MSAEWVLWGRYKGTPLRIMGGTLAEVRREWRFRFDLEERLAATNPAVLTDLRLRRAGEGYGS